MKKDEDLTIEKLSKKYDDKSQFDLVNYSIKLAVEMIKSDREPRVDIDTQNRASQVLAEMVAGKDFMESVDVEASDAHDEGEHQAAV